MLVAPYVPRLLGGARRFTVGTGSED
jgi:hypothetical protein